MIALFIDIFDTDRSGTINYVEFEGLYRYIKASLILFVPGRSLTDIQCTGLVQHLSAI